MESVEKIGVHHSGHSSALRASVLGTYMTCMEHIMAHGPETAKATRGWKTFAKPEITPWLFIGVAREDHVL